MLAPMRSHLVGSTLCLWLLIACDDSQKVLTPSVKPDTLPGPDTGQPPPDAAPGVDIAPSGCQTAADCPATPCQTLTCASGACVAAALPDGVPCDTGDACIVDETCLAGACTGGKPLPCNDGDLCTADTCVGGKCAYTASTGGCEDGNPCTIADFCKDGVCTGGSNACPCGPPAFSCALYDKGDACVGTYKCEAGICIVDPSTAPNCPLGALNQCMVAGCIEGTGSCGGIPVNKGTVCDDEDPCTIGDACEGGVCKSGPRNCPCAADGDCAPFEDGDLCNGLLRCINSQCVRDTFSVIECDDGGNACAAVACNPSTGACESAAKEGETCSDGDACTQFDSCVGTQCAGIAADCNDSNPCTSDTCGFDGGCLHTPLTGTCDDGNECTEGDLCEAGACAPGKDVCSCTTDVDCAAFDDGDACTGVLVCLGAKCTVKLGSTVTCDQTLSSQCQAHVCKKGACAFEPVNEGGLCNDNDPCTTGDACAAGVCQPSGNECACIAKEANYLKCGDKKVGWSNAAFGSTKAVDAWEGCATGDWSSKEFAWPVFVTKPTKFTVSLSKETVKTALFVLRDAGAGCTPASCEETHPSNVTFVVAPGETVYVVVDAKDGATGEFDLDVACDFAFEPLCDNGKDEDGDGVTDCADEDCAADPWCSTPEECLNQIDDDNDLLTDCADPDCSSTETCMSVCTPVTSPKAYCNFQQGFHTSGESEVANYNCFGAEGLDGPEIFYTWTPSESVNAVVELTNAYFGAQVIVLEALEGTCNAQNCLSAGLDQAFFTAFAGTTYYIGVDGPPGGGTYQLKVTCP